MKLPLTFSFEKKNNKRNDVRNVWILCNPITSILFKNLNQRKNNDQNKSENIEFQWQKIAFIEK